MNDQKFKKYIFNVISLLKMQAFQAKENTDYLKINFKDYAEGMIMGYYSIITLFKHEAFALCIDQRELGLSEIEPEEDLLGLHKNPDILGQEDNFSICPMTEENISGYLLDTIALLKEQAIEAKRDLENSKKDDFEYNRGHLMSYCAVFSLLKQQAWLFNVNQTEIGLDNLNPEIDLLHFQ